MSDTTVGAPNALVSLHTYALLPPPPSHIATFPATSMTGTLAMSSCALLRWRGAAAAAPVVCGRGGKRRAGSARGVFRGPANGNTGLASSATRPAKHDVRSCGSSRLLAWRLSSRRARDEPSGRVAELTWTAVDSAARALVTTSDVTRANERRAAPSILRGTCGRRGPVGTCGGGPARNFKFTVGTGARAWYRLGTARDPESPSIVDSESRDTQQSSPERPRP